MDQPVCVCTCVRAEAGQKEEGMVVGDITSMYVIVCMSVCADCVCVCGVCVCVCVCVRVCVRTEAQAMGCWERETQKKTRETFKHFQKHHC